MRFSVAIVLAFVALVSACYVPFNDVRFTNATFASEFFATVKNDAGQGWASIVVNNSPVKPWPLVPAPPTDLPGDEGLVTIPYCYRTAEDRLALQEVMEGGVKIWRDALPKPSQANGIRFAGFREYGRDGTFPPCWDKNTNFWNPAVHHGTLMIQQEPGSDAHGDWATVGYMPRTSSIGGGKYEDRHQLHLRESTYSMDERKVIAAHELGHVMGFVHEHQRHDRDKYIRFNCEGLDGYAEAKKRLDKSDYPLTMDEVCESNWYGRMPGIDWGFITNYSKDMGSTNDGTRIVQTSGTYDEHSIMHYASDENCKGTKHHLKDFPLVKWKKTGDQAPPPDTIPTDDNAVFIRWSTSPTGGDVAGVKQMYPW